MSFFLSPKTVASEYSVVTIGLGFLTGGHCDPHLRQGEAAHPNPPYWTHFCFGYCFILS